MIKFLNNTHVMRIIMALIVGLSIINYINTDFWPWLIIAVMNVVSIGLTFVPSRKK